MEKNSDANGELPKAVIFDFDGTILDTEWAIYETWRDLFHSEGQELPIPTYAQCVGSGFHTWSPETHLESLTGKTYDWDTINRARQIPIRKNLAAMGPRLGILALLDYFLTKKIPLAIASSSSHNWVDSWIEKLNLKKYFTHVICREDAKQIKPAPDLFLKAAQALNTHPQQCWVIEDSLNGLKAAQAANIPAIITHHRITAHSDFSSAYAVYENCQS